MTYSDFRIYGIVTSKLKQEDVDMIASIFDQVATEDYFAVESILQAVELDKKKLRFFRVLFPFRAFGAFLMEGVSGYQEYAAFHLKMKTFMTSSPQELTKAYYEEIHARR